MSVAGVPLSFLFGRPLLTLLYRREYADHVGLLALFMGTAGVTTIGAFIYCGMNAARLFRVQFPVYIMATLTCAVGSAVLVPRLGLIGAGLAVLLSAVVIVLGGLNAMQRALKAQAKIAKTMKYVSQVK
jgi:O-antigen/teichoic acid export membrane protein